MATNAAFEIIWKFCNYGVSPGDSDQERLKKAILTLTALIIAFLAIFWGALYIYVGYPLSGAIPLTYSAFSFASIIFFFVTKSFSFFRFSQLLFILLLPFLLMWSLGGFANGSVVMFWAFFTPLAALFFADTIEVRRWLFAFISLTVVSAFVDPYVKNHVHQMEPLYNIAFFAMNLSAGFLSIYFILMFFVKDREQSHQRAIEAKEQALAAQTELEKANALLRENEAKIRELMLTDPLTGVANRRHLEERLEMEFKRLHRYQHQLAIVLADIDFFKRINDDYGHDVGDHALKDFANTLKTCTRDVDFIARIGGEEFLLILPETDQNGALTLVERIRTTFAAQRIASLDKPITASFGIAMAISGETGHECMKRADKALYVSKDQGRNRITLADNIN